MRTLLIDADITAYQFASRAEKSIDWGDGLWTLHADAEYTIDRITDHVARLEKLLDADAVVMVLSDPDANFRKDILPTYKSNRKGNRKPVCWAQVRAHLKDAYRSYEKPTLEGDDVLAILATHPTLIEGEKLVVSIDKDFHCVPCNLYRGGAADEIERITEAEADYFHMVQTLTGDAVDGYSGCPGIGPKKAEVILTPADDQQLEGDEYLAWAWQQVVAAYVKAGLGEGEALVQARCARILRADDYNFKKKEPILWCPPSSV